MEATHPAGPGPLGAGHIGQIHITVDDLERSIAFYADALGLPLLFRVEGQPMAFLDAGGIRLYLGQAEGSVVRSQPLLYFSVDDIDASHAGLVARGVPFVSAPHLVHRGEDADLWMAFFRDPDGGLLALMAERPRPAE
jgi:catechol 2,3-dioxygenase-like lactoylglutathione lyase family enzyme